MEGIQFFLNGWNYMLNQVYQWYLDNFLYQEDFSFYGVFQIFEMFGKFEFFQSNT
ncbi:unnamed protein product [Paramecium sonneborni]|uniref:Uncharacterized protein n=1 Tax=Paramecium sonneborni TaxID=65129 RepID=A0A8S1QYH5_9CILI|nr:unnamed protein product [Paramecium sonneborni]